MAERSLLKKIDALISSLQVLGAKVDELKEENERLKNELEEAHARIRVLEEERERVRSRLKGLLQRLSRIEESILKRERIGG